MLDGTIARWGRDLYRFSRSSLCHGQSPGFSPLIWLVSAAPALTAIGLQTSHATIGNGRQVVDIVGGSSTADRSSGRVGHVDANSIRARCSMCLFPDNYR